MAQDLYDRLRRDVEQLNRRSKSQESRSERSEFTAAVVAFELADAPTTGVGNNTSYTSLAWISDGRKPGEGGGAGTGVLAYWDAINAAWYSVFDQLAVVV